MQANDNEARLAAILRTAIDGIITIDEQGAIQSCNPAACRIFGYDPAELIGRNVNMLMPSPYHEEHDRYLRDYLRTGERKIIGIGREVVGLRRDGQTFPMDLAVTELTLDGQRGFTGIVRDITERKEAQARQAELVKQLSELNEELELRVQERTRELRAAQAELVQKERLAMLGRVSGGIAHEIRNPLNAVKTSVYYLLNARNPSEEKIREHLDRIDRQVTLANTVVTTLTDFARLPTPMMQQVDLGKWLPAVVQSVAMPAGIDLRIDCPPSTPAIQADAEQLAIALRNLLRNAKDAVGQGGRIEVTAVPVGNGPDAAVDLSVRDTGVGIPSELLDQILEPLFTTKARGIGLGLAIVHSIVEKNGGQLRVSSIPSSGSTFTIRLKPWNDALP